MVYYLFFHSAILILILGIEVDVDTILPALGINLASNMALAIKRESILRKWVLK